MAKRTWEDQPERCEQAEVLWLVHATDVGIIEIRGMPYSFDALHTREYLVTVGNLFGSQTVRTHDEDNLFKLLRCISKKTTNLPERCEVIENAVSKAI